jgi:hypothetical protein
VGDLDGSGYALPRFYEDRVSFKDEFVDLPADFSWQREERTLGSVGAWITHGETRRDEDGCVLVPRKMLKDVGKGDGLICERGPQIVTFMGTLGNGFGGTGECHVIHPRT